LAPSRALPAAGGDNRAMAAPAARPRIAVIWHGRTGGTRAMVDACVAGARQAGEVEVEVVPAPEASADTVLAAQAVVFATPENLAAIGGLMKDFFDRSYYDLLERVNGLPCAFMVCAGSDGHNAVRQLERIATGLRLRPVAPALIVNVGAQTPAAIRAQKVLRPQDTERCRELGATLAAGLALGIF
jgi:NAD(P)H-dependent FMN reductase